MRTRLFVVGIALTALLAACGGDDTASTTTSASGPGTTAEPTTPGLRVVAADDAAAALAERTDLVLLDVRTPEEFADGHVDGASLIDFYDADFADRIGELDPDASYVVYCRSGNRSGQTVELMRQLGFTDVQDVDGGVLAWAEAGLPLTTP